MAKEPDTRIPEDKKRLRGDIELSDFSDALEAIKVSFGEPWLRNLTGNNPMQKAWRSVDWLSSIQLANLGYSIRPLLELEGKWLAKTAQAAKSKDSNSARGFLFELFIVGALRRAFGLRAVPASVGQKAYDVTVNFDDGAQARISLKSFGYSHFEREFKAKMASVRDDLKASISASAYQALIQATTPVTTCAQWEALNKLKIRLSGNWDGTFVDEEEDIWRMALAPLNRPDLDSKQRSDTFMAFAPFHNNEQKNIFSKIGEAVAAFRKHEIDETETSINLVIAQVSMSQDIADSASFVRQYFEDHKDIPCSGVFLVQPNLLADQNGNRFALVEQVVLNKFNTSGNSFYSTKDRSFNLPLLSVAMLHDSPKLNFVVDGNIHPQLTIKGRYFYQAGDHFKLYHWDGRSKLTAAIGGGNYGVREHASVVTPFRSFALSEKYALDFQLSLLFGEV